MLLEVAVKNVERSALKVILMTLLFISIPQSLMAELTPRERIAELSNKASIIEVEAQKLSEYLLENPLPTNASEALKNRYHAQELLLNSMRNRSSNLLKLSARLSEVIKGEPSESEITKVVTILNNVDTELETRPLPTPEFIAVVPQQSRIEVRALPPIETRVIPNRNVEDKERSLQESFGDIEYNIQKAQEKEAESRRQRGAAEGLADVEYQADLAAQERREKDSQRRIQEQFGDIEYNIQKAQEKEAELRRQRALAEGLADVENQADLALNQERAEIPIDPVASIQPVVAPIVDTPIVDTSLVSTTAPRIGEERLPAADPTTRPQERPAVEERKKLSDILIDPMEDFNLLPNRVGARERRIRITGRNVKIRVIGSRNGMYKVELHENGVKQPGTYFINKRWAHKTLNFTAALAAVNGLESMSEAGNAPVPECRPGEDQPVDINEIREVVAQEIVETSSDEFKPGCEVLAGNLNSALEDELQTCLMSIKRSITQGARNGSGRIDREKLFCNMYKNLRPEEQHFAGSLFTSIGEAGIIATSSQTAAPGYQEQVFVMKVLDNRLRKARADTRNNNLNALDMSLIHKQFSMYNSSIFPDFRDLFEPSGRAYRQSENKAIKAFISFQSNPGALEPADQVDNMNMYFNPHGMTRISNLRATRYKSADQRRREARNLVARLKREGKIASNYPDDRIAPGWSFGQLEPVNDLSYDGVSVRKTRPYMHQFYSNTSGRLYYGQGHDVPPSWRNQCSN